MHAEALPARTSWLERTASLLSLPKSRPTASATPLATVVVLALALTWLILRLDPGEVAPVVAWTSTNVQNLATHPLAALLSSPFIVTGNLLPELPIVAVSFVTLERALGTRRTFLVALAGQVIATLVTEYGAELVARLQLSTGFSADRDDVGVSYAMYAVLAAALMTLSRRTRHLGLIILSGYLVVAFLQAPGMTSTGHLLCVGIGVISSRPPPPRRRRQRAVVGAEKVSSSAVDFSVSGASIL